MISHQQKVTSAFTLIEAIVTLFLISLFCLFQFVPSDYSKDKMSEKQFWQNFRQNWNNLSIQHFTNFNYFSEFLNPRPV